MRRQSSSNRKMQAYSQHHKDDDYDWLVDKVSE